MTALRFMSNFSTQSRTGAGDPHIGLLCGNRAGIRERFRIPRLFSGWTYLNILNRFWCLCGQICLDDVVGDHSGCVFPHRAPRGATWDTWAHILWMRNVVGTAPLSKAVEKYANQIDYTSSGWLGHRRAVKVPLKRVLVLPTSKEWRLQRKGRQSGRHSMKMKSDWLFDKPRSYYWLRVSASNLTSQSTCVAGVTQSHCNPQ